MSRSRSQRPATSSERRSATYSRQGRGGKGRLGATAKNEDFVEHLFIASTHAYLMIFTDDGQVFKIKVHEIPEAAAVGTR